VRDPKREMMRREKVKNDLSPHEDLPNGVTAQPAGNNFMTYKGMLALDDILNFLIFTRS
jgi:hypothetical protein